MYLLARNVSIEPTPTMSDNYKEAVASQMAGTLNGISGEGYSFTLWSADGVATFTAAGPDGRLVFYFDDRGPGFTVTTMPRGAEPGHLKDLVESALDRAARLVCAQQ